MSGRRKGSKLGRKVRLDRSDGKSELLPNLSGWGGIEKVGDVSGEFNPKRQKTTDDTDVGASLQTSQQRRSNSDEICMETPDRVLLSTQDEEHIVAETPASNQNLDALATADTKRDHGLQKMPMQNRTDVCTTKSGDIAVIENIFSSQTEISKNPQAVTSGTRTAAELPLRSPLYSDLYPSVSPITYADGVHAFIVPTLLGCPETAASDFCPKSSTPIPNEPISHKKRASNANLTVEDGLFLMKMWGLTRSSALVLEQFIPLLHEEKHEFQEIYRFICGRVNTGSYNDLLRFLKRSPHKLFGWSFTYLMILEWSSTLSLADLITLYTTMENLTAHLRDFLEKVVVLFTQRNIQLHLLDGATFDSLPNDLLESLDCSIVGERSFEGQALVLKTVVEMKSLATLRKMVYAKLFGDVDSEKPTLMDETYTYSERIRMWTHVISEYFDGLAVGSKWPSVFQILLQWNLHHGNDAESFGFIRHDTTYTPIFIHRSVLMRFSDGNINPEAVILATPIDLDTLCSIMYTSYSLELLKGKITKGVILLAQHLHFRGIAKHLFGGYRFEELTTPETRKDVLQALISMRCKKALLQIGSNFKNVFPNPEWTQLLDGLEAEDVVYFLNEIPLHIEEIYIYYMILKWSFHKANRPCPNVVMARYDEDAFRNFQLVRSVLRLARLKSHFDCLLKQRYIKPEDVKVASLVLLADDSIVYTNLEQMWFQTTPRC